MRTETITALEQIKLIPWFSRVGKNFGEDVFVCRNWDEAIRFASDLQWQNHKLRQANKLAEKILSISMERYMEWNDIAVENRNIINQIVIPIISEYATTNNLSPKLVSSVRWDILHLLMEAHYSDLSPPAFYAGNAYFYLQGHFPCGFHLTESHSMPRIF